MTIAAALVKPITTGSDKKSTKTPKRNKPSSNCKTPTISAKIAAYAKYSPVVKPMGTSAAAVMSEITANGPFCSCRDEPKIAATIGARKDAYKPM